MPVLLHPGDAISAGMLERTLAASPRFGSAAVIVAHGVLTIGLALLIHPATSDLWIYAVLGLFVGGLAAAASRLGFAGGYLLATVDLAMGETVTGASRFVAGMPQLSLLAIGIVIGAQLVGDPHSGPVAGSAADTLGAWSPWAGVVLFGAGIYVHNSAPPRSFPWLLVVLFAAWIGQLAGKRIVDATLSGFIGAAVMVPVTHAAAHAPHAPPAHVMFLPAFWLLVPGTIGLIGIIEIVGTTPRPARATSPPCSSRSRRWRSGSSSARWSCAPPVPHGIGTGRAYRSSGR